MRWSPRTRSWRTSSGPCWALRLTWQRRSTWRGWNIHSHAGGLYLPKDERQSVKPPASRSALCRHSVWRGEHKSGADHLPMRAGAQQADGRNVSQIIDDSWCTKYLTPMFSEGLWPVRSWIRARWATASDQFCVGSEVATLTSVWKESGPWRCWMPS